MQNGEVAMALPVCPSGADWEERQLDDRTLPDLRSMWIWIPKYAPAWFDETTFLISHGRPCYPTTHLSSGLM